MQVSVKQESGGGKLRQGVVHGADGHLRGGGELPDRAPGQRRSAQQCEGHPVAGAVQGKCVCSPLACGAGGGRNWRLGAAGREGDRRSIEGQMDVASVVQEAHAHVRELSGSGVVEPVVHDERDPARFRGGDLGEPDCRSDLHPIQMGSAAQDESPPRLGVHRQRGDIPEPSADQTSLDIACQLVPTGVQKIHAFNISEQALKLNRSFGQAGGFRTGGVHGPVMCALPERGLASTCPCRALRAKRLADLGMKKPQPTRRSALSTGGFAGVRERT